MADDVCTKLGTVPAAARGGAIVKEDIMIPTKLNQNSRTGGSAKFVLAAAISCAALASPGCDNALQGAGSGAALGALAGLGLGSLGGHMGAGAAAGAIIGGIGGLIIGDQNHRHSD